jgi:ATP-dependent RNA helicase RhlB
VISGEVPQKKRLATLEGFRSGNIRVLVATDVAGRGLHIEGISHVINFTMPHEPENYVHRIGRTGRAGATGTSVSFACEDDSFYIPGIEEFIGHELPCTQPEDDWLKLPEPPPGKPRGEGRKPKPRRRKRSSRSRSRSRRPPK